MNDLLSWFDPSNALAWATDHIWVTAAVGIPLAALIVWRLIRGGLAVRRAVVNVAGIGLVAWGTLWFVDWVQPSLTSDDLFVAPVVGPQPVKVALVNQKTMIKTATYTGTAHPYERVTIRARSSGFIQRVSVYPGDAVKAGKVLAKLETTELAPRLEHAQAELHYLRAELKRDERLLKRGAISAATLDLSRSKERVAAARSKLLKTEIGFATIIAPSDGWTSERMVDPGQFVQKGQAILVYDRLAKVRLRFGVAEQDIAFITQESDVVLEFPQIPLTKAQSSNWKAHLLETYKNPAIGSRVSAVFPGLDPKSRLGVVEVVIDNPDLIIRSNTYVIGHFIVAQAEDAWVVPEQALTPMPEGKTVIFLGPTFSDQGEVEMREVRVGLRNGREAQILEGLEESASVVYVGNRSLTDGENVMVIHRMGGL